MASDEGSIIRGVVPLTHGGDGRTLSASGSAFDFVHPAATSARLSLANLLSDSHVEYALGLLREEANTGNTECWIDLTVRLARTHREESRQWQGLILADGDSYSKRTVSLMSSAESIVTVPWRCTALQPMRGIRLPWSVSLPCSLN